MLVGKLVYLNLQERLLGSIVTDDRGGIRKLPHSNRQAATLMPGRQEGTGWVAGNSDS